MNKTLKKLTMALALCGALCGTAMAAPKGGAPAKGKAPTAMTAKAPAPAKHVAKTPTHGHGHVGPAKPAHRHEVARHTPPPPPRHPEPRHHHDHHGDNCFVLGATLLGGLVGGLLSAVL